MSVEQQLAQEFQCLVRRASRRGKLDLVELAGIVSSVNAEHEPVLAQDELPELFFRASTCHLVAVLPREARSVGSFCGYALAEGPASRIFLEVPGHWDALLSVAWALAVAFLGPRRDAWPQILIDAELSPRALGQLAERAAKRIAAYLAEMGLWDRPLHLWLGPEMVVDCLSPYTRELREVLVAWAAGHLAQVGSDLSDLSPQVPEHVLYAIARDFAHTDRELVEERLAAERTVGIRHYADGALAFDVVDLSRLDQGVIDARLPRLSWIGPAPVLIRVSANCQDPGGTLVDELLLSVGDHVRSITLLGDCDPTALGEGAIVLPESVIGFESGQTLSWPAAPGFSREDFFKTHDAAVVRGALLTVSVPEFLDADELAMLQKERAVCAIVPQSGGFFTALSEAMRSGTLTGAVDVAWGAVAVGYACSGRPTVSSLAGQAAATVTRLTRLFAGVAGSGPRSPKVGRRKPPSGGFRLKA